MEDATVLLPESGSERTIADLTRKLSLKAIEFNRYILRYRIEANRQPKWRFLRYSVAQEAQSSCYMTSGIIMTGHLGAHVNTPQFIHKSIVRGALKTGMVGYIVGGSSSAFELGCNLLRDWRNSRDGFSPRQAIAYLSQSLKEADQLMMERERLVNALPEGNMRSKLMLEGEIFKDLRRYYLNESLIFQADTSEFRTYQNVFYLLNTAANAVATASSLCSLKGLSERKYSGTGSVLEIVTGGLLMGAPLLSSALAVVARKHASHMFGNKVGKADPLDYAHMREILKKIEMLDADGGATAAVQGLPQRIGLYAVGAEKFRYTLEEEGKTLYKMRRVAVQTNLFGPPIGGTVLAQGILGAIAYYNFSRNPVTLTKAQSATRCNYAGALASTIGGASAVGLTAAALIATLIYERKLAKQHKLPNQLIEEQLDYLDKVEQKIRNAT